MCVCVCVCVCVFPCLGIYLKGDTLFLGPQMLIPFKRSNFLCMAGTREKKTPKRQRKRERETEREREREREVKSVIPQHVSISVSWETGPLSH